MVCNCIYPLYNADICKKCQVYTSEKDFYKTPSIFETKMMENNLADPGCIVISTNKTTEVYDFKGNLLEKRVKK